MKSKRIRNAFTLVEVLIVVVIMAILAATIIPQFTDASKDAKISNVKFNLHTLRSQIELYKSQHNGKAPSADLSELMTRTNAAGTKISGSGDTADFPYGPYIRKIPANPFTGKNTVTKITNSPAQSGDVTSSGGWLYNDTVGGIWIDHADYFTE